MGRGRSKRKERLARNLRLRASSLKVRGLFYRSATEAGVSYRRAPVSFLESAFSAYMPWRSTLVVIERPVLQSPLTLLWSGSGKKAKGIRKIQTPARTTPRAETFLEPDRQSHRETFFLFHRARRIFFLMSQKENGGCIPPAKPAFPAPGPTPP